MRVVGLFRRKFFAHRSRWFPGGASTIISATFSIAGVASSAIVAAAVTPTTFTAAGAATESPVGGAIAAASLSSAGVGGSSLVGAGVLTGVLSATGVGSASFAGGTYSVMTFQFAGTSAVAMGTELRQIVSTKMLQNPVDCVLAGDQDLVRRGRVSGRALRRAFGE